MVVVSREEHGGDRLALSGRRDDGHQRAGPVLLHLHGGVEHVERARLRQAIHQRTEQLRVHVVDLALDLHDAFGGARRLRRPARRAGSATRSACLWDRDRRRRSRCASMRIAGSGPNSRAYAVTSSAPVGVTSSVVPVPYTGTPVSSRAVAGAGTGNTPCAQSTVPPPTFSGDDDDVARCRTTRTPYTAPTISMIESSAPTSCRCTRSIGVSWIAASASRQPLEQLDGALLARRRQRRPPDCRDDVLEMMVLVRCRRPTRPSIRSRSAGTSSPLPRRGSRARPSRRRIRSPGCPSAPRSPSSGSPRSSSAPRIMSPDAPEKAVEIQRRHTRTCLLP